LTEVGIDIIEIARIGAALSRWENKFRNFVFLASEIEFCEARSDPVQHYAARFAAKEAVAKALKWCARVLPMWMSSHEPSLPWLLRMNGTTRAFQRRQ